MACAYQTWCGRRDSNPHAEALDPKSSVSANFTTPAAQSILDYVRTKIKYFFNVVLLVENATAFGLKYTFQVPQ